MLWFRQVWLASVLEAVKVSPLIEKVSDHKDFKKLLRTRTNVLVLYTKTGEMFIHCHIGWVERGMLFLTQVMSSFTKIVKRIV